MIVLTRNPSFNEPGVTVVPSWSTALQAGFKAARQTGSGTIVAFGGAEIFVRALPLAVRIHKTEVHMQPAGDVRFPEFDLQHWREVSRDRHPAGAAGIPPACSFVVLDRIGNAAAPARRDHSSLTRRRPRTGRCRGSRANHDRRHTP